MFDVLSDFDAGFLNKLAEHEVVRVDEEVHPYAQTVRLPELELICVDEVQDGLKVLRADSFDLDDLLAFELSVRSQHRLEIVTPRLQNRGIGSDLGAILEKKENIIKALKVSEVVQIRIVLDIHEVELLFRAQILTTSQTVTVSEV